MTIIPQGSLSWTELRMLGNNLVSRPRRDPELGAVNRSIAMHDEEVDELAPPADARPGAGRGTLDAPRRGGFARLVISAALLSAVLSSGMTVALFGLGAGGTGAAPAASLHKAAHGFGQLGGLRCGRDRGLPLLQPADERQQLGKLLLRASILL